MVTETFTIWEILGGMLLSFICGYLFHWGQTESKDKEVRNNGRKEILC